MLKYGFAILLLSASIALEANYPIYCQPAPEGDRIKVGERKKESIKFQNIGKRGFLFFKLPGVVDIATIPVLTFTLDAPVAGRVTLFYYSSAKVLVSVDVRIETAPGKNTYEIDLSKVHCGREYRAKDIPGYEKFGAADGKISGLRIDFWYPDGTELAISDLALNKATTEK